LHAFVAGVAIWAVIHFKVRNHDCQQASNKLSLAGLVCIAIAGAYAEGYKLSDSTMVLGGMFFLWGLLSAALIYVLNFLQPVNMAGLRGLAGLGKVSFSLYLVHIPICSGLSRYPNIWSLTQTPEVNFLLYLVMVLGLSYLLARMLFYFVENPGIELGRILIMRLSTQ
jgi:peptidoglycan/LPS O-acetylase OafA/YrhL